MPLSPQFLATFSKVLTDAKARAPREPLSLAVAKDWNKQVFEAVAATQAGQYRTNARTTRWLGRDQSGNYFPVDVSAHPVAKAGGRVSNAYQNFERGMPNAIQHGDVAKALAWPVLATLDGQPFKVGNLLTAAIVLNFAARRAGLELSRIDWSDPDLRYRVYLGLRPGAATAEPLADYLRPRLGTQESPEGPNATHVVDLDKVGQDGGYGSAVSPPPVKRRHRGGGPRDVRRAGRRPPLPPPASTDYP